MGRAKTPADQPHENYLVAKLDDLDKFLKSNDAKRNGAAFVAGTRLAATLRGELEAIRNPVGQPAADPTAGLTDAEVRLALVEGLRALPLAELDEVLDLLGAERLARVAPMLRVVDGRE